MNFTSTHDISRAIEIFACQTDFQKFGEWAWNLLDESIDWAKSHNLTARQYKLGKNLMKSYMYALAFFPGTFSVFYGDEVGMRGAGNLANRGSYPWGRRDKDLLRFFRKLIKTRKNEAFLKKAKFRLITINTEQLIYERYDGTEKILVAVSRTHKETSLEIPEEYKDATVLLRKRGCRPDFLEPFGAIILKK